MTEEVFCGSFLWEYLTTATLPDLLNQKTGTKEVSFSFILLSASNGKSVRLPDWFTPLGQNLFGEKMLVGGSTYLCMCACVCVRVCVCVCNPDTRQPCHDPGV